MKPLFPLPLNSIERFHFYDDDPAFPNNFFGRIHFAGRLNTVLVRQAFEIASCRHVWGNVTVTRNNNALHWKQQDGLTPDLRIIEAEHEMDVESCTAINPERESPARFVVVVGNDESTLTVQAHHAMSDGLGGIQFLRDWMLIYDNLVNERAADFNLSEVDPQSLKRRGIVGASGWRYWKHAWKQPLALFGAAKFVWRRFAVLGGQSQNQVSDALSGFPCILDRQLNRDTLNRIRAFTVKHQVPLNSFLCASLFQSIAAQLSPEQMKQCIRMISPISIRDRDDARLPAANRTTLVQLDRFEREMNDAVGLAKGITFELGLIRNWFLDRWFLLTIRGISISERWLRRTASSKRPRATTLFTNLGKAFLKTGLQHQDRKLVCGGLRVDKIVLAPPIRSYLPISFASIQYAGELTLSAHLDLRFLSLDSGNKIMDDWLKRLHDAAIESTIVGVPT
ncbi:MAG: hypothetical protein R3C03_08935 [Pirellulaceae bacterium]